MSESIPSQPNAEAAPANYTKVPNFILDNLADMSNQGSRVLLAICRQTSGWQRRTVELSLKDLQDMTGMSHQGVINGIKEGMANGVIVRRALGDNTRDGYKYALRIRTATDEKIAWKKPISPPKHSPLLNDVDKQNEVLMPVNDVDKKPEKLLNDVENIKRKSLVLNKSVSVEVAADVENPLPSTHTFVAPTPPHPVHTHSGPLMPTTTKKSPPLNPLRLALAEVCHRSTDPDVFRSILTKDEVQNIRLWEKFLSDQFGGDLVAAGNEVRRRFSPTAWTGCPLYFKLIITEWENQKSGQPKAPPSAKFHQPTCNTPDVDATGQLLARRNRAKEEKLARQMSEAAAGAAP